ncbi:MAG: Uma2 family endonuclease [Cyanobacteria bacterium P01_A01_bin.17]
MVQASPKTLTLQEFLQQPETKPAREYADGVITQKPMPKGRHSRLQGKLCETINRVSEDAQVAYAFPELRCSFGERSVVPDVAVFQWEQIPFTEDGHVPDNFNRPPDWTIEILSPEQRPNQVLDNILYCLENGSCLGWFIDPDDLSVLFLLPQQQPVLCRGDRVLPVLPNLDLTLTASKVFSWLKMG